MARDLRGVLRPVNVVFLAAFPAVYGLERRGKPG
jgi:hypothetical protein